MIEIYTHELRWRKQRGLTFGIWDRCQEEEEEKCCAATNDKEAEEEEEEARLSEPKTCPHCSEPNKPEKSSKLNRIYEY